MSCVIGIFPTERTRKQPVTIDMCLYLDTRRAAESANIHDTIDYAGAVKEISFILDHCEFLLIETAVEAVCRHFLLTYQADHSLPTIDAVMVRISKPSALTHGIVPAVQILRRRSDYTVSATKTTSHNLYTIHSAQDSALHLLIAGDDSAINVTSIVKTAESVLPIGRWQIDDQPIKSRSPVQIDRSANQQFVSIQTQPHGSRVLLIQSRPENS